MERYQWDRCIEDDFEEYAIKDEVGLSILEVVSHQDRSGREEMAWMISSVEQRNSSGHALGESVGDGDERGESSC